MRLVDKVHSKQDRHFAHFRAVQEWAPEVELEVRSLIPLWQEALQSTLPGLRLEIFERVFEPEYFKFGTEKSLFQALFPWRRCEVEAEFPDSASIIRFRKQFKDQARRFEFTTTYSQRILYRFFEYHDLYAGLDVPGQPDVFLGEYPVFFEPPFVGDLVSFEMGGGMGNRIRIIR